MARRKGTGKVLRIAALFALILLIVAALLVVGSGPAYRVGLLDLGDAFTMLRRGIMVAFAAAGLGLITLIAAFWRGRLFPAVTGAVAIAGTVALLAIPFVHWQQAQQVPPIHDITTDTENPPAFEALVSAREEAPNAVDYPGEETARQQHDAYPDIEPLYLNASLATVREAAETEVLAFGWEVVDVAEHRIEATATTTWFGFQDDVVLRLTEEEEGVRVDMRSASRIGRSDLGTNAARIRAYLDALGRRLEQP